MVKQESRKVFYKPDHKHEHNNNIKLAVQKATPCWVVLVAAHLICSFGVI
jgi:hypothetical protein